MIKQSFDLGASGFLSKTAKAQETIHAIRTVARGEKYVDGLPSNVIVSLLTTDKKSPDSNGQSSDFSLTDRQMEIIQLTAKGYSAAEIGLMLKISEQTVVKHKKIILAKGRKELKVPNMISLIVKLMHMGLLKMENMDEWQEPEI